MDILCPELREQLQEEDGVTVLTSIVLVELRADYISHTHRATYPLPERHLNARTDVFDGSMVDDLVVVVVVVVCMEV